MNLVIHAVSHNMLVLARRTTYHIRDRRHTYILCIVHHAVCVCVRAQGIYILPIKWIGLFSTATTTTTAADRVYSVIRNAFANSNIFKLYQVNQSVRFAIDETNLSDHCIGFSV